jgi:hypothetical protein
MSRKKIKKAEYHIVRATVPFERLLDLCDIRPKSRCHWCSITSPTDRGSICVYRSEIVTIRFEIETPTRR